VRQDELPGARLRVVRNRDSITFDATSQTITLGMPAKELKARLEVWKQPHPRYYTRVVLTKYAATVTSASEGVVTDRDL